MKKNLLLCILLLVTTMHAGTGGSELASWYNDISAALQGSWGKIIAAAFLGIAIILFKGGGIIAGLFMMMIGMSIGTIPTIIDSRYTALAIIHTDKNFIQILNWLY